MKEYNTAKAIIAQHEYCKDKNLPEFAPQNGICWRCGRFIYLDGGWSVDYASKNLITGCPHCHYSFCE